ncbi:MAG: hypothetical protein V4602_03390 [Pseudomonadota bacterium]
MHEDLVRLQRRVAHEVIALGHIRVDHLREEPAAPVTALWTRVISLAMAAFFAASSRPAGAVSDTSAWMPRWLK